MSKLGIWQARLAARRPLRARAQESVRYWARRAGSAHGKAMLREAVNRRTLRGQQVATAQRGVARNTTVLHVSNAGVAFVASFEGFRPRAYRDSVGVLTIGFGETQGIEHMPQPITRTRALGMLRNRLDRDYLSHVRSVARAAGLQLTQHQADALASLTYNLGVGILDPGRTMGDALRSHDRGRIAAAFLVYDKAGGQPLPGLTRRRRAERALFLKGA